MLTAQNSKNADTKSILTASHPQGEYNLGLGDFRIRDPFVLADKKNGTYYMPANAGERVRMYKSRDLVHWKDLGIVFQPDANFWGKSDFWAPDLYHYKNKYYLFITLSAPNAKRGTSVLVADSPEGPFTPLVNKAATPPEWMSLDGSLFIDKNNSPWMLYCHEWVQVGDGKVVAQKLSQDLTRTVGEPVVLFSASQAPWTKGISKDGKSDYVTDAPFIHKLKNGQLVMLWSSFRKNGHYAIGQATSKSGNVLGPWTHEPEPLNDDDGGHAMLFTDNKGRLMISYHAPNSKAERAVIREARIKNGKVTIID